MKRLVSFIMLVALLISTIVPAVIAGPPPKGYDAVEVDEHTWGGEQRAGPDFWDYTQLTVRTIFNVL